MATITVRPEILEGNYYARIGCLRAIRQYFYCQNLSQFIWHNQFPGLQLNAPVPLGNCLLGVHHQQKCMSILRFLFVSYSGVGRRPVLVGQRKESNANSVVYVVVE